MSSATPHPMLIVTDTSIFKEYYFTPPNIWVELCIRYGDGRVIVRERRHTNVQLLFAILLAFRLINVCVLEFIFGTDHVSGIVYVGTCHLLQDPSHGLHCKSSPRSILMSLTFFLPLLSPKRFFAAHTTGSNLRGSLVLSPSTLNTCVKS